MTFSASFLRWAREEADRPWANAEYAAGLEAIAQARQDRTTAPIDPHASDRALCDLARRRADWMTDAIGAAREVITVDWLNTRLEQLEARPFDGIKCGAGPVADQLAGMVKRACCPHWWRRQVRRAAVRKREAQAQAAGRVSVRTGQLYVTDETLQRRQARHAANRAILEATEIEAADGQILSLWAAVEASTANKAIRRGELMTRIRGCDEWAQARGLVGMFTTNTLPSRFHAQLFKGGKNPKWDGSTPREGQGWLRKTWARTRAALHRERIAIFGFRIAEPHHDGCPHWHMLMWTEPGKLERLQEIMRKQWLREDGDEPGAQDHRVKFEVLDPARGSAAAYVSKYIAKNIDDFGAVGTEGHRDEYGGEQLELVEGGRKAQRVEAWAGEWGIRQFQAIGQPPVTVWRELRRIDGQAVQGGTRALVAAHEAVNRAGERRACWRAYMDAQGGAMTGRAYQLRLLAETEPRQGRYGTTYQPRPLGVYDKARPEVAATSNRKRWRPRGTWEASEQAEARHGLAGWARGAYLGAWARAAQPTAQPRTRVNNCTRGPRVDLMKAGIVGASFGEPGGFEDSTPWATPTTPPTPAPTAAPTPPRPSSSAPNDWHARLLRHRHLVGCAPI